MADRPILFSAPMVRALLAGTKAQTRRVLNSVPQMPVADCHETNVQRHPAPYLDAYCGERKTAANPRGMGQFWNWWQVDDRACLPQVRVGYVPGDRLWVRESWSVGPVYDKTPPRDINPGNVPNWCGIYFPATKKPIGCRIRPGIHMPRWASRLTLNVTEVRVERLQDISEADAKAEGAAPWTGAMQSYRTDYRRIWNEINGVDAWSANPWVVAITFTTHHQNIDALEAQEAA